MTKLYTETNDSSSYSRHLIKGSVTGNLGITSAYRYSAIYGESISQIEVLRRIQKENTFRFWWYLIFSVITIALFAIWPKSWLGAIEFFIMMINIDLVARGKVIGIYIGILDCLLYIIICAQSALWGEVIKVVAISIPLNIVTIISWMKNLKSQASKSSSNSIKINKLTLKTTVIFICVFALCCVAGYFFLGFIGTTSLIISSIALSIGIVSKILSSGCYMEAYAVSLIGNVISLVLWLSVMISSFDASAPMQMAMVVACLTNNLYGYFLWKGMYRKATINGGKILVKRPVKISRVIKLRRVYKNLYWDKKVDVNKNS